MVEEPTAILGMPFGTHRLEVKHDPQTTYGTIVHIVFINLFAVSGPGDIIVRLANLVISEPQRRVNFHLR
ncbi:hypothetical protein BFV67_22920 (plasmid) [Enterobacter roggenkampii]|nr:hypothetical protein BFV67_22920 [Enterobacter roggenkampii]